MAELTEEVAINVFSYERGCWSPSAFDPDPLVNAVLNVAAQVAVQAAATNELLLGLKYGKKEGLSIAEAIEVAGKGVSAAIEMITRE